MFLDDILFDLNKRLREILHGLRHRKRLFSRKCSDKTSKWIVLLSLVYKVFIDWVKESETIGVN